MSELIDSFDRLKAEELHKTQAAQKEIVRLLQTLARLLKSLTTSPACVCRSR